MRLDASGFLPRVVSELLARYGSELNQLALVLPSRRACLYTKKYIASAITTHSRLPDVFSSDEFIRSLSQTDVWHDARLLLELFKSYHATAPPNSTNPYKNFEDFTAFGLAVLNDFNTIDLTFGSEAESVALFQYLGEADALSRWSADLAPEQHERVRKNKRVSAYLDSWKHLSDTYLHFRKSLRQQNRAYSGMVYRQVSRDILNIADHWPYSKVIFIGVSQASDVELSMLKKLVANQLAEVFVDADDFYTNQIAIHEAGMYLRRLKQELALADLKFTEKYIQSSPKTIELLASPNNVLQAKYVGHYLHQLFEDLQKKNALEDFKQALNHTVVILPDEQLLTPLLAALPDLPEGYTAADFINITMGVPLSHSPLAALVEIVFTMQNRLIENAKGQINVFFKDIMRLLQHPYIFEPSIAKNQAIKRIQDEKLIFMTLEELSAIDSFYAQLFESWQGDTQKAFLFFEKLTQYLYKRFKEQARSEAEIAVQLEYVFHFHTLLQRVRQVLAHGQIPIKVNGLKRLIQDFMRETKLAFAGEPLKPIQIMGLLESRNLDFENVIILSCNEKVLPKTRSLNSIIPYEIRLEKQIPTHEQTDAALAYLFYRLLHRAKHVQLLYLRGRFNDQVPEKSRFLIQIEHEWSKFEHIKLAHKNIALSLPQNTARQTQLHKNEEVLKNIREYLLKEGLSPTTLAHYIKSPLDFYRQRVLKIKPVLELSEDLSDMLLGVIIHRVLEKLFMPYVGQEVTRERLVAMQKNATPEWLTQQIREAAQEYSSKIDLEVSNNFLNVEIIKHLIPRYLEAEMAEDPEEDKFFYPFLVLGTEKAMQKHIEIEDNGIKQCILLEGVIDRLDYVKAPQGHYFRILDYKSGKESLKRISLDKEKKNETNNYEVNFAKNILEQKDKNLPKLLQMFFYESLVREEIEKNRLEMPSDNIQSGFWFLNNLEEGFQRYDPNLKLGSTSEDALQLTLKIFISEHLLNPNLPLTEAIDSEAFVSASV